MADISAEEKSLVEGAPRIKCLRAFDLLGCAQVFLPLLGSCSGGSPRRPTVAGPGRPG